MHTVRFQGAKARILTDGTDITDPNRKNMTPGNQQIRFVLSRTSHPGNIGAAARAIRTMGFGRLALVMPQHYPDPQVEALASGADDVLAAITVHDALEHALADSTLALGMSARRRGVTLPEHTPRQAAERVHEAVTAGEQVSLVFGNERSGLDGAELAHCHAMVRIPSIDDFSSLNLAQAVQVMAYEMRLAMLDEVIESPEPRDALATGEEMEQFYAHLAITLEAIDFHKGRATHTIDKRLRKMFQRARLDQRELRILHGILADAERMARLASERDSR